MNPDEQVKLEIKKREDATTAEMRKELDRIVEKPLNTLTKADKEFLQARRSYLTRAQADEYKDVLAENLHAAKLKREALEAKAQETGETEEDTGDPLLLLTRAELEAKGTELGFLDVSKKAFRTNQDLIDAINAA